MGSAECEGRVMRVQCSSGTGGNLCNTVIRAHTPHQAVSCCTVWYSSVLYCTMLCSTVTYCTVMYYTVLYRTILYFTVHNLTLCAPFIVIRLVRDKTNQIRPVFSVNPRYQI